MDENVKNALFVANGKKIDDQYFFFLGIANGGYWDSETKSMFEMFVYQNFIKQNENEQPLSKDKKPSPQEAEAVLAEKPLPHEVEFGTITEKRPNLRKKIDQILWEWDNDFILLSDLLERIKIIPAPVKRSVINCLTTLAKKGIVRKTKGQWKKIEIIKKIDPESVH